jgi:hypothetical protein
MKLLIQKTLLQLKVMLKLTEVCHNHTAGHRDRLFLSSTVLVLSILLSFSSTHAGLQDPIYPEPDKDMDGYESQLGARTDCDDTNRLIYPGISTACTVSTLNDGWRTCQANGTYTSCVKHTVAPLCEKTRSGRCLYIDPVKGNDANNGSFIRPWRSFAKINSPSGSLVTGDVVYLMNGTFKDTYNIAYRGTRTLYLKDKVGITIKAYPGAKPIIDVDVVSCPIHLDGSSRIVIEGVEIANSPIGTNCEGGILFWGGTDNEVRNMSIHHIDGSADNNNACIHSVSPINHNYHHNTLADCYDAGSTNTRNNSAVVLFGGTGSRIHHNLISYTNPASSSTNVGLGIKQKHGAKDGTLEADHNIIWNAKECALCSGQPNSYFHHNLVLNSWSVCKFIDWGGPTYHQNERCEFNTGVNTAVGVYYDPTNGYGPIGPLSFKSNILSANSNYGSQELGIATIGVYLPDALYTDVVGGKKLIFADNRYYNAAQPFDFELFTAVSQGPLGRTYDFSSWRSAGYDTGALSVNPRLDASYKPTAAECSNQGWLAGTASVPTGPTVAGLWLVNADTDQVLFEILSDMRIDLATLGTRNLNVEAKANSVAVKVQFGLDGNANYRTEGVRPFALFGDTSGNFAAWTPTLRQYAISATGIDTAGAKGGTLTRLVTFTDSCPTCP